MVGLNSDDSEADEDERKELSLTIIALLYAAAFWVFFIPLSLFDCPYPISTAEESAYKNSRIVCLYSEKKSA